jgi:type I restriction enzyme, S subunit
MSWQQSTLGDLVKGFGGLIQTGPFGSQLKQSEYSEEGVPVIMPTNIFDGRVNVNKIARVPDAKAARLARHRIKPDTIVFPRRGEITKRAYITEDQSGWICGTGCLKIEAPENIILPKFLYYQMGTDDSVDWLQKNAVGATMLNLSGEILARYPVRFPDLPTQQRIAEILSAYDDLIENNRRRIGLLEQAARLLYREWFVHLRFPGHETAKIVDGLPEGWERATLSDHIELVKDAVQPGAFRPDDVHIGLEHIPRRSFVLSEWEPTESLESHKFRFAAGDIIFGKIRPYFHKVGFALRDGVASSDAFVWRVKEQKAWALLVCATSSDHFVAVASKTVKEGSKMPRADWKVLAKYKIPEPNDDLLAEFDGRVRPIAEECRKLALQNRALTRARDLLLPRLMDGRIPV